MKPHIQSVHMLPSCGTIRIVQNDEKHLCVNESEYSTHHFIAGITKNEHKMWILLSNELRLFPLWSSCF